MVSNSTQTWVEKLFSCQITLPFETSVSCVAAKMMSHLSSATCSSNSVHRALNMCRNCDRHWAIVTFDPLTLPPSESCEKDRALMGLSCGFPNEWREANPAPFISLTCIDKPLAKKNGSGRSFPYESQGWPFICTDRARVVFLLVFTPRQMTVLLVTPASVWVHVNP